MYEHEIPRVSLVISILMFQYNYIQSIPKPFKIPLSKEKSLSFLSI
jgi:hypothetical protein